MNTRGLSLITVYGLGSLRPAPGTWGSLPPIALASILIASGYGPHQSPIVYHVLLVLLLLVGQCLPLLALPAAALATPALSAFTIFLAFIAFRLLDIVKPWPAHTLQREPGGWGILLDDLAAGLYAFIVLHALAFFML